MAEKGTGGSGLMEILTRKMGPAPVWVYGVVGVLALAWWLSRNRAAEEPESTTDVTDMEFPEAQPMGYTSDVYVNVNVPTTPGNSSGSSRILPRRNAYGTGAFTLPRRSGFSGLAPNLPVRSAPETGGVVPPSRFLTVSNVIRRGDGVGWDVASGGVKGGVSTALDNSVLGAIADQHGFPSPYRNTVALPSTRFVVPVS